MTQKSLRPGLRFAGGKRVQKTAFLIIKGFAGLMALIAKSSNAKKRRQRQRTKS